MRRLRPEGHGRGQTLAGSATDTMRRLKPAGHGRGQTPAMSVTDTDEIQAPGRGGRARLGSVAAFEQGGKLVRRALDHRSHERADHVPKEALGGDLELERVAAAVPDSALDRSREHPVPGFRGGERPEIV